MTRVLSVMGRVPWPMDDGWKIRCGNLLLGLRDAGAELDLLAFGDPSATPPAPFDTLFNRRLLAPRESSYSVASLVRGVVTRTPLPVWNYRDEQLRQLSASLRAQTYDVVLVEDVVMTPYVEGLRSTIRIVDMHNVESLLLERFAAQTGSFAKAAYANMTARKLRRFESATLARFDAALVCSENDEMALRSLAGADGTIAVIPNGVDCSYFSPMHAPGRKLADGRAIVFVGSMDYHANSSAMCYFVDRVLPLVLARHDARLTIVGKNPTADVRALAGDRVTVTGAVDDVRPFVAGADVVIAPLLVGGGTRLKILEAMAMQRAVVSTSVGCEGITARHGHELLIADGAPEFAGQIDRLLTDGSLRTAMGSAARHFVLENYDWHVVNRRLQTVLADLRAPGRRGSAA